MEGKTGLEPEMEMRTGKQEQGREEGEKRGSKGELRNGGSSPDTNCLRKGIECEWDEGG